MALTTLLDMFLVLLFIAACVLWSGWEFIKAYRGKLEVPASSVTHRWLEQTVAATTYGISLNTLDQLARSR